jgi:hypothetical protein
MSYRIKFRGLDLEVRGTTIWDNNGLDDFPYFEVEAVAYGGVDVLPLLYEVGDDVVEQIGVAVQESLQENE